MSARDYARAIDLYCGGKQKSMAARLEVSEGWLSRYLSLARLPDAVVAAFASIRDLRELHARTLKPLLAKPQGRGKVLAEAARLAAEQRAARDGQGRALEPAEVIARLKAVVARPKPKPAAIKRYRMMSGESGITARRSGQKTVLEVPDILSRAAVEAALTQFLDDRFGKV